VSGSVAGTLIAGVALLMAWRIMSRVAKAQNAEVVDVFSWPSSRMMTGSGMARRTAQETFRLLLREAGVCQRAGDPRPRIHDARHTFAVASLLGWYRDGADVQARLPLLSTWLGHSDPRHTYWYLSAAPELLALAAQRLEPPAGTP
jgi:integrase